MIIAIRSTESQKQELMQKGFGKKNVTIQWIEPGKNFTGINADVFFDLIFDDINFSNNEFINDKPVFIHAVNCVCKEINKPNHIRLNAWNGFLNRPVTELTCCNDEWRKEAEDVFSKLEWRFVWVKDDYGFIAARIIAMIINEAYYALEENVSTKQQIDIAMKLGTNYPYGPFEWSEKIGLSNIFSLLQKLSKQDKRYTISSLLVHNSQKY
jgi:3-hydroxybutyryl-CoA dehydrogenase